VADLGTMATADPHGAEGAAGATRAVRRARSLPGGRAVVGALLVAAAAVGVFAAYLNATAEPDTRYLVARRTVEPGTRLDGTHTLTETFESRAIDLDPGLAARAVPLEEAESLLGRLVIVPLEAGDLLLRSSIVADGGVASAHKLSFAVDRAAALAGALRAGERIDVLATYGAGDSAFTAYVVRGVPLVAVSGEPGSAGLGGGSGGPLVLTVAVTAPEDVQALAHAVATADIVVTRSTVNEGDPTPAPAPYVPSRDRPGPRPDPAGDPVGTADDPDPGADPDGADTAEEPASGGDAETTEEDDG
jgi:Flp pilus assembly protein CpaB